MGIRSSIQSKASPAFINTVTIIFLLFSGTFPPLFFLGLIMMFVLTTWPKAIKILISIVLLAPAAILFIFLILFNPNFYSFRYYPQCLPIPPYSTYDAGLGSKAYVSDSRRSCVLDAIVKSEDVALCERGGLYGNTPEECYRRILSKNAFGNPELCKLATNEGEVVQCIYEQAKNDNSQDWCLTYRDEILQNRYSLSECYLEVAEFQKDEKICKNVSPTLQDKYQKFAQTFKCLEQVAVAKQDPQVCEQYKEYKQLWPLTEAQLSESIANCKKNVLD